MSDNKHELWDGEHKDAAPTEINKEFFSAARYVTRCTSYIHEELDKVVRELHAGDPTLMEVENIVVLVSNIRKAIVQINDANMAGLFGVPFTRVKFETEVDES